jgi:dephospho-CoA kinase
MDKKAKKRCPVIGLVGGIGSGKSTVAAAFGRLGALVINADRIAHQVLNSSEVRARIAAEFGADVIAPDGGIDRAILAKKAFTTSDQVLRLNAIVHPAVIDQTKGIIETAHREGNCPAVALDAPLIIEAGLRDLCDTLVFVEASDGLRAQRLQTGRGWDVKEIERREKFQESLIYKRQQADYTVDNNGSPEDAARQAAVIWEKIVDV